MYDKISSSNINIYFLRISFKDLRDGTSQNPLSDEDILSLWTPRLTITNGLSEFDTKVTEDSVGMLLSYVRKRSKAERPDQEVNIIRDHMKMYFLK